MITRREWLYGIGMLAGAAVQPVHAAGEATPHPESAPELDLSQFEPRSMLQAHQSRVVRARYPLIDFHTHITRSVKCENGVALSADRKFLGTPESLIAVMDRKNIRAMVNLTGGYDQGLAEVVQ